MKSIYIALGVHVFDWLSDVLVIQQWLHEEEEEEVDTHALAFCSIGVIIFSSVVSAVAVLVDEGNIRRALFQFFDLLIYEVEIYI